LGGTKDEDEDEEKILGGTKDEDEDEMIFELFSRLFITLTI
jgi:hypothetical protein